MGKIVYTPQLIQTVPLAPTNLTTGMNVFEKVFFHINEFIEACKKFGVAWGDFWDSPLQNTLDFIVSGIDGIATFFATNIEIFVIAAMVGAYLIMSGRTEKGQKVISGAIWGLFIVKVVSSYL